MADYVQRLEIDEILEVPTDSPKTAYLQRVTLIEAIDENGDKWEPKNDAPDPFD